MLVVNKLKIGYKDAILTDDFSCEFKQGDVVVLLGDNGIGKSTLLKTMCGLIEPLAGDVKLANSNEVGWVDSFKPTSEYLTIENYLTFGLSIKHQEVVFLLQSFKLELNLDSFISEISDGQFRKLAICRQLLKKPRILFLDEPSVYLDYSSKLHLVEVIIEFSKTGLVFCSSHDKDFSDRIGNKRIIMSKTGYEFDF